MRASSPHRTVVVLSDGQPRGVLRRPWRARWLTVLGAAALVAGLLSFPGGTANAQNAGPTTSSVSVSSSPANALFYLTGETIRISVNFTSVVEVGGSPTLAVDVGGTEREAAFESALGSEMLFAYTVTDDDFDGDGVSVGADKLSLGSDDTITDSGSRAASLTHVAVSGGSGHRVNMSVVTIVADSDEPVPENETAGFTVSRTGSLARELSVSLRAERRQYFVYTSRVPRTVKLEAGQATAQFEVPLANDSDVEIEDGSLTVILGEGLGYLVGSPGSAVAVLTDDNDILLGIVTVTGGTVVEGFSSTVRVGVTVQNNQPARDRPPDRIAFALTTRNIDTTSTSDPSLFPGDIGFVAVDVEQNNVKGDRRFFIPRISETEWDGDSAIITIPFEYRPLSGGENVTYGTTKQQDKVITEAISANPVQLRDSAQATAALGGDLRTDGNGPVSRLEHHLRRYVRRNNSDFFIHKDLAGFLNRELDFYLKNDVLNLDNLAVAGKDTAKGWFQQLRLTKAVGNKIIDFLAQIEDFQKMLWEKRKFVTDTQYCISLGNIGPEFYLEIAENEAQWEEWRELMEVDGSDRIEGFLRTHPTLEVDTKHFDTGFADRLLASFEDLDGITDGVLFHSENWQALRLLLEKYTGSTQCIYLDPPYNSKTSEILYKNEYRHSSWLSLIDNRLEISGRFATPTSAWTFPPPTCCANTTPFV